MVSKRTWVVSMNDGSFLATHKSGSGALVYYQGMSEPETTSFLTRFLRPGMVFVDAGAHIGEYTVRAARLVTGAGEVHAFEPSPGTFAVLERSVELNHLQHVHLNQAALFDRDTEVSFHVDAQPTLSAIQAKSAPASHAPTTIPVKAMRLDSYWGTAARAIDLVKVDVEGAELDVIRGASGLKDRPLWIFEYSRENYSNQGHQAEDVLRELTEVGYGLWFWNGTRTIPLSQSVLNDVTFTNIVAAPAEWRGLGTE